MTETLNLRPATVIPGQPTPADEIADAISTLCVLIGEKGHTMSSACSMLGLQRMTVERWVERSDEHRGAVARARASFRQELMDSARSCQTKWGTPDPQVAMFLLERTQEDLRPERKQGDTNINVTIDVRSLERLQGLQRRTNQPVIEAEIVPQTQITG